MSPRWCAPWPSRWRPATGPRRSGCTTWYCATTRPTGGFPTPSGPRSAPRRWTGPGSPRPAIRPVAGGWRSGTPTSTCTWWPPWPGRTAGHRGCGATTGRWPRWPRTTSSASGCAPPPAGTTTPPPPGPGSRTRSPPSGPAAPHRGTCSGARSRPRPRPAAGSRVHRGAGRRRGDRLATDERTPSRPGDRLRGLPGRLGQRRRRAGALRRRQARPRPDPAQACPDRLSLLPCRVFDQHQAVQVHLPVAVVAHIHGESEYPSGAGTLSLKVLLDPQSDSLSLLLLPPPSFLTPGLDALPQQDHVDYGHADRRPLSH